MAIIYPTLENIQLLKVKPTEGEWCLVRYLKEHLDDSYEVFFNPYLDGDRPDIIILKEHCAAFIIEVKDWDLRHYLIDEDNKWRVTANSRSSLISSPHAQAFRYKKNLYDLHLPVIGLARLTNPNFYNLVHCFVYFHGASQIKINNMYLLPEQGNKEEQTKQNELVKQKKIRFGDYEKANKSLDRKNRNIQRDKLMSIGSDNLSLLINKIKKNSKHVLFNHDVYNDFKRRLSPSNHTLKQGLSINLDKKQLGLSISKEGKAKIKGVAGCGKTSILSQRAINAYKRHKTPTLILTFNITLKNYIRDKISDIQGGRDFQFFEISNYHQFFNAQVNNTGQDIVALIGKYGLEKMYSIDVFKNLETIQYQTILLDEIQDYESDWVKIIRDNFLSEGGEMVLFGDQSQNVYQREVGRASVVAQGFGSWIKLNRSYRTDIDSPLNQLFKDFQLKYLIEKYSDTEIFDTTKTQIGMNFNLLKYKHINSDCWYGEVFDLIKDYISSYDLHPNDVVILSSKINVIRKLNDFWLEQERTHCMFENYSELSILTNETTDTLKKLDEKNLNILIRANKDSIERVRRAKKNHFYANSGLIKLSTIHSFKGLESKTVFYVLHEGDEPEIVYTSVTRTTENLVILDVGKKNQYSAFFKQSII
ncbi:nuclease-related domain-containing DEAD/DEAH box helicase [Colwellia hornerae]|uniref:DNA 3'-5' helicase II n=1 Tax=Colwellia hornerae TaxID=89402 RepID=A0A5C6Q258_9GAMM|nr:NERD domain-containing protein/DEAD/DEAH box helicase [Colwellia hornerae]TWX45736.1 AAA family ATPase [Colwellia hornerae]TWX53609.1 AAA family ATPase [Colwellia hornerae]TWX62734.1 AAA family ATPase [Colwellia hornerae]